MATRTKKELADHIAALTGNRRVVTEKVIQFRLSSIHQNQLAGEGVRFCRAFGLIDLLVVVAIIALVIGILIPTAQKAREAPKITVCKTHLKSYHRALLIFAEYNGGRMIPYAASRDATQPLYWWHQMLGNFEYAAHVLPEGMKPVEILSPETQRDLECPTATCNNSYDNEKGVVKYRGNYDGTHWYAYNGGASDGRIQDRSAAFMWLCDALRRFIEDSQPAKWPPEMPDPWHGRSEYFRNCVCYRHEVNLSQGTGKANFMFSDGSVRHYSYPDDQFPTLKANRKLWGTRDADGNF